MLRSTQTQAEIHKIRAVQILDQIQASILNENAIPTPSMFTRLHSELNQCHTVSPKMRGIAKNHLQALEQGVAIRSRSALTPLKRLLDILE